MYHPNNAIITVDKEGKVNYAEYGDYGTGGIVRNLPGNLPKVEFDKEGNPTEASMKSLLKAIAGWKKVPYVEGAYLNLDQKDWKKIDDYIRKSRDDSKSNEYKKYRGNYNAITRNCSGCVCDAMYSTSIIPLPSVPTIPWTMTTPSFGVKKYSSKPAPKKDENPVPPVKKPVPPAKKETENKPPDTVGAYKENIFNVRC